MEIHDVTWREFKDAIEEHITKKGGPRICRGQSDASWKLTTSLHRLKGRPAMDIYFSMIPRLADTLGTVMGKHINAKTPEEQASFLALIQHHGFPTPILDWTNSPYIAAYFAFAGIDEVSPKSDKCAVYVFNHAAWQSHFKQQYDINDKSIHVSVLVPNLLGNVRQFAQQGNVYTFTNVEDIENHICVLEQARKVTFLEKYQFSVKEKHVALSDLELMGIQAYSLYGGADGLCKFLRDSIFRTDHVGSTPSERLQAIMDAFKPATGSDNQKAT